MKKRAATLLLVLLAGGHAHSGATNLEARVCVVSLPNWDYGQLITFLGSRAGYRVTVGSNALDNAMTNRSGNVGFFARFDNITVRDALSWTLRFANASARSAESTLFVSASAGIPMLPEELRLPEGEQKKLPESSVTVTLREENWDVRQLLEFLSFKAGLEFILDPSIVTNSSKLKVSFDNTPVMDALEDVVVRAGVEHRTHGKMLYFRRREERVRHGAGR